MKHITLVAVAILTIAPGIATVAEGRPRARDLDVPFEGNPGTWNALTDVPGVEVGYVTLIEGEGAKAVRTGVTAIHPRGKASATPVFAGVSILHGNGEMTGAAVVEEFGWFNGPILLTNTDSVGIAHDASIAWQLRQPAYKDNLNEAPIVSETWDGYLNDIHGFHVKAEHVFDALDRAQSGPIAEGNVGGGTGMRCHRFKGGTGTASRRTDSGYTVGVLVQANYGWRETLTIAGVPVGREIPEEAASAELRSGAWSRSGSIIVVVATNAPLVSPTLKAVAKRATIGLARVGGMGYTTSGDLFIAFSTANDQAQDPSARTWRVTVVADETIVNQLYTATVQATEEAIVNALVAAETMSGRDGKTLQSLPHERLREVLRQYNRLAPSRDK